MSFELKSPVHHDSLADVLERILDKGIVVAGDVSISLVGIELLTIRLRLLIATVDKVKEMGINWWEADPSLSTTARQSDDARTEIAVRLARLEQMVETLVEQKALTS